ADHHPVTGGGALELGQRGCRGPRSRAAAWLRLVGDRPGGKGADRGGGDAAAWTTLPPDGVRARPGGTVPPAGVVTRLREQLYDRLDGERARVVILGGPGAGKTAAMLLLLIDV